MICGKFSVCMNKSSNANINKLKKHILFQISPSCNSNHDPGIGACKRGGFGGRGVESVLGDDLGVCFVEGLQSLADGGLGEGVAEGAGEALADGSGDFDGRLRQLDDPFGGLLTRGVPPGDAAAMSCWGTCRGTAGDAAKGSEELDERLCILASSCSPTAVKASFGGKGGPGMRGEAWGVA